MSTTTYMGEFTREDREAMVASRVRAFRKATEERHAKGELSEDETERLRSGDTLENIFKDLVKAYRLEMLVKFDLLSSIETGRKPSLVVQAVETASRAGIMVWEKGADRKAAAEAEATEAKPLVAIPGYTKAKLSGLASLAKEHDMKLPASVLSTGATAYGIRSKSTGKVRIVTDSETVGVLNHLFDAFRLAKEEKRTRDARAIGHQLAEAGVEA